MATRRGACFNALEPSMACPWLREAINLGIATVRDGKCAGLARTHDDDRVAWW